MISGGSDEFPPAPDSIGNLDKRAKRAIHGLAFLRKSARYSQTVDLWYIHNYTTLYIHGVPTIGAEKWPGVRFVQEPGMSRK